MNNKNNTICDIAKLSDIVTQNTYSNRFVIICDSLFNKTPVSFFCTTLCYCVDMSEKNLCFYFIFEYRSTIL